MRETYIRFAVYARNAESHRREGLFQAARRLRDSHILERHDLQELDDLREWFGLYLRVPARFARSRRSGARSEAICWFRPRARDHICRMRQMAAILARYDMPTVTVTTSRPGYIVYEDAHQIAAVPFRDTLA